MKKSNVSPPEPADQAVGSQRDVAVCKSLRVMLGASRLAARGIRRPFLVVSLMALSLAGANRTLADERVPVEAVRAINLARTYVVRLNGGLEVYRPARCMFATAAQSNPCLVRSDGEGFLFRFMGGPPTWEQTDSEPTVETEILISPSGTEVEELIFNGDPR
ncbi:MAG: hypothetical protein AAFX65_05150 [Cyanobacteria bacterium J06638_7]